MFCPQCSQPQMSGEARFCSRCGFQLAANFQLQRIGEAPFIAGSYHNNHQRQERLPLVKREELRKGAKLIFLSFFSVIPSFILAGIFDTGLPLIIPVITFLVGVAQAFYYFLFGESLLPVKKTEFAAGEIGRQFNFQPTPDATFSGYEARSFNTAEFTQSPPPGITETTANFIKNR